MTERDDTANDRPTDRRGGAATEGDLDDARLMMLIKARSEDAFRYLVDTVAPRIKGVLIRGFGRHHEDHIEDALAEALQTAWFEIGRYDPERGALPAWIFGIARNALLTTLRSQAAGPLLEELHADVEDSRARGATKPSAGRQHQLDNLRRCIDRLSPMQRDIILSDLRNGQSANARELAERWDTTDNVIRVSRHKAHKRLRSFMEESR